MGKQNDLANIPIHRLRWRFLFANKPDRVGIWNGASGKPEDSAWVVSKEGLVAAVIEAENTFNWQQARLLTIQGDDYVSAQWEAFVRMPGMGPVAGEVKHRPNIWGLSFLTRTDKITVTIAGEVSSRPLREEEKKFKFYEHSAGT